MAEECFESSSVLLGHVGDVVSLLIEFLAEPVGSRKPVAIQVLKFAAGGFAADAGRGFIPEGTHFGAGLHDGDWQVVTGMIGYGQRLRLRVRFPVRGTAIGWLVCRFRRGFAGGAC